MNDYIYIFNTDILRKIKRISLIALVLLSSIFTIKPLHSQPPSQNITIQGYIIKKRSRETIPGAHITIQPLTLDATPHITISSEKGAFSGKNS